MSTETKAAETTSKPANDTKAVKSARVTLIANTTTMQLNAKARKDGSAETFVTTIEDGKKPVRGMTQKHASMEVARTVLEAHAKKAESLGWKRKAVGAGFKAQPDAFSTLPAPPKTTGKK